MMAHDQEKGNNSEFGRNFKANMVSKYEIAKERGYKQNFFKNRK